MSSSVNPFGLPPEEAIRWFREKGYKVGFDYRDTWGKEHARAFTVAKATQLDVLADIRQAVDAAIRNGGTLNEFRKGLRPLLQAKGWWGEKELIDPTDGKTKLVQLGSAARLRTIYETNLRQSMAAGREERFQRLKARRPYARYVAILDGRERPEHKAWHGVVLPLDDPWWDTHTPPNGWGCRCKKQSLSAADLARYGYQVNAEAPPVKLVSYTNERTGQVLRVPAGIDPGFDYNPGSVPRGFTPPDNAPALDPPGETWRSKSLPSAAELRARGDLPAAVERWYDIRDRNDATQRWVEMLGGPTKEVADPTGMQVTFNLRYLDHLIKTEGLERAGIAPRALQTVQDPTEIWLVPHRVASGRVVMRQVYVGLYAERKLGYSVVAQRTDEGTVAWTTVPTARIDNVREGYLLYRRPK